MNACRHSTSNLGSERGIALLTTIMMMVLMSALLVGFITAVMSDQVYRTIDRDRARAFYGAQSGIEKQNADLAKLFTTTVGPSDAQIVALGNAVNRPTLPYITFVTTGASPAYAVTPLGPADPGIISSGPYEGLMALKRQLRLDATARAVDGGEVHLLRTVETVAIPVFQFGIFSDVDLSFSAADDFDFGGRVHTNSNLFLAQGQGTKLTLREKVTAVEQIVRQRLSNGESIDASNSNGLVLATRGNRTGPFKPLLRTEGSVTDGVNPVALNNNWPTISLSTYASNIRNGRTGVRPLNLDLVTANGANIDLITRPPSTEAATSPIFGERYFKKVSVRVLLSDKASDITSLPTVSPTAPIKLEDWTTPPAGYAIAANRPPIARSAGPQLAPAGSGLITSGVSVNTTNSANVPVNVMPDYYKLPANMTVTTNAGVTVTLNVNCTGQTQTTVTGCTRPGTGGALAIPSGAVLWATPRTIGGPAVQMSIGSFTWNNGATVTLTATGAAATFPTLPLSVNAFFVDDKNTLVTCTGYDTTPRFTGCNVPRALVGNVDRVGTGYLTATGVGTIGGFLKVEIQTSADTWRDVTVEFLNYGISDDNLAGRPCADPTPNAILRLQRLRDNNEPASLASCSYQGSIRPTDHWPNVLFDAREGSVRDSPPAGHNSRLTVGGVMHYVALDVRNLSLWFARTGVYGAGTGNLAMREGGSPTAGYSIYFSDRRNNRDDVSEETGEFGWEDVVNPGSGSGAPNLALDAGEDMNGNTLLDRYGRLTSYDGVVGTVPPGAAFPLDVNAVPTTFIGGGEARVNRALHFRRALKLINGALGNIVAPGLTVAAENPVYIQGDWNASVSAGWGNPHVATSVAADSVTLLSNSWNDGNSFGTAANPDPYAMNNRRRSSNTYYRVAIISGKGPVFPRPSGTGATYGTDGGAHSFLRFIEGEAMSGDKIWYRGSMVTFYYHRQAVNPFKCCNGMVYGVPTREYLFDTDFLDPALLPPLTPVFRDINALGFTQETRPGR